MNEKTRGWDLSTSCQCHSDELHAVHVRNNIQHLSSTLVTTTDMYVVITRRPLLAFHVGLAALYGVLMFRNRGRAILDGDL